MKKYVPTENSKIYSAKHAVLRSKSKDGLARHQKYVSEWSDMSTRGLLIHLPSTIKFQLRSLFLFGLVQCGHHHIIECNLFSPRYSWNIYHFDVKRQSLTHSGTISVLPLHIYRHILKNNMHWSMNFVDVARASKRKFKFKNLRKVGDTDLKRRFQVYKLVWNHKL